MPAAPSTHPRDVVLNRISGERAVISWTPLTLIEARGFITNYEISYWTVVSDGLDKMSVQVRSAYMRSGCMDVSSVEM